MTEYFIYKYLLKVRIFRRETSKSALFSSTAQLIYSVTLQCTSTKHSPGDTELNH